MRGEITSHFSRRTSRDAAWPLHFKFASYANALLQGFLIPVTYLPMQASLPHAKLHVTWHYTMLLKLMFCFTTRKLWK